MDAKVIWKSRMSFSGSAGSGFSIPLGTSPDVGGDNDGFRPMELLAIGLAGCTAMDVISIMQKKKQEVTTFEVKVHADLAEDHPHVFTRIVIEYILGGRNIERVGRPRHDERASEKYCPAQAMFSKVAPIELKITIQE